MERQVCTYTQCFCEENVWKLLQEQAPRIAPDDARWAACFISNPNKTVAVACQALSSHREGVVVWDYHVIALGPDPQTGELCVYDLDTKLDFPCSIEVYWQHAFPTHWIREQFHPVFRVVPRHKFMEHFSSDRSHMLCDTGEYSAPPPSYPPIQRDGVATNLMEYVDMERNDHTKGMVCTSLEQVVAFLESQPPNTVHMG